MGCLLSVVVLGMLAPTFAGADISMRGYHWELRQSGARATLCASELEAA